MRKDIYSAFGDFMIYGLGAVAMQAVSILLIPVYTRWLGVADYGVLSLLMGIQFMLVPLAQAGMGSALFRSYYDYNDEAGHRGVINTAFWLLLPVGAWRAVSKRASSSGRPRGSGLNPRTERRMRMSRCRSSGLTGEVRGMGRKSASGSSSWRRAPVGHTATQWPQRMQG